MLKIDDLSVSVLNSDIIKNLSLYIPPQSLHVLMGPNGSGKSTLSYALAGHPRYELRAKELLFLYQDFLLLSPDKRARLGFFLAVQNPPEIPGVNVFQFLKDAHAACTGEHSSIKKFQQEVEYYLGILRLDKYFLQRSLYENFSGGEKKRLELLQLLVLKPKFALLDEVDSGLDIDALTIVSSAIKMFRKENPQSSLLVITHNPRIAHLLHPDRIHILHRGSLVCSGDIDLINDLELKGYDGIIRR